MSLVSLITGGTRGIGQALALRLLARGHHVAVTGTTPDGVARAERALAETCADAGRVLGLVCDVRDHASAERAVQTVVARFGGLDVLVNNAGVGVGQPIAELPHDEWDRIIGTNLTGVFNCCRAAIPHLVRRGGGWIVSISSLASKNPFVGGAAYCASKAGLNAFSEALMQELRHSNIRVSYVLPGSVATGFSGREPDSGADWKLSPDDVAQAIEDLLDHPARSLPSRIEIRPSRPVK
jgi:NAD(P)-dependent dehydrogenase (short-subunit alcohol dehydrogenase family)